MVDYLKSTDKLVQCSLGHRFKISTNKIVAKCPICGNYNAFYNLGTIDGEFH